MSRPLLPESAYEALGLDAATIKVLMNPKPPDAPPDIAAPNLLHSDEASARPLDPNDTSITLYAELLLHIRTITLFASLRTHHSYSTKAKLSSDGTCITVAHEGRSASIRMPFNVKGKGEAELELPSQPHSKEITMRLQLEELEDSDVLGALQSEERKANVVPWDGASLDKQTDVEVRCKSCDGVIVPEDKVAQWRDLPNENWAEMMDFWHCHKPDEHHLHDHTHEEAVGAKGYAAGNRLEAAAGIGFVDLTSFLLHEQDCQGAQVTSKEDTQERFVICRHCNATLGTPDDDADGWRIWKWNIDIRSRSFPRTKAPTYSTQKWITARLLHLIENTGIRKFHIYPTPPPPPTDSTTASPVPSLLLWVFTPDLLFSSSISSKGRTDPTRAMKVFYENKTWSPLQPGEPESASIEDVEFPAELFGELRRGLERSQRVLPPTARRFKGWDVGVLQRFDLGDLVVRKDTEEEDRGNEADGEGDGDEEDGRDAANHEDAEGKSPDEKGNQD